MVRPDENRGCRIRSRRPCSDCGFAGDAGAWLATSDQTLGDRGVLQLVFGESGPVTDFEVVRYGGCYFVKF